MRVREAVFLISIFFPMKGAATWKLRIVRKRESKRDLRSIAVLE